MYECFDWTNNCVYSIEIEDKAKKKIENKRIFLLLLFDVRLYYAHLWITYMVKNMKLILFSHYFFLLNKINIHLEYDYRDWSGRVVALALCVVVSIRKFREVNCAQRLP